MVEVDAAVGNGFLRLGEISHIGDLVQDLRDPASAGCAHGDHDKDHGEHHQGHENAHHIAEQAGQAAGGQVACHDEVRAEPGDGKDAAIDYQHHHRVIQRQVTLRLDEQTIKFFRSLARISCFRGPPARTP